MSIFRITVSDKKLMRYLSFRKGYIKAKYNTVFVKVEEHSDMVELEKFIISHNLKYDVKNNAKDFNKHMSYSHFCAYNIKGSDISGFKKSFHKFMSAFNENVNKGIFIIFKDYELITENSTLTEIRINIISNIDNETSKSWFDYYYIRALNKFLKSKYYVSKKSAV